MFAGIPNQGFQTSLDGTHLGESPPTRDLTAIQENTILIAAIKCREADTALQAALAGEQTKSSTTVEHIATNNELKEKVKSRLAQRKKS